jgi:hypothetical protein
MPTVVNVGQGVHRRFAVFRLMTSLNLAGAWTGSLPELAIARCRRGVEFIDNDARRKCAHH